MANPAYESLKRFGSMVGDKLAYPGQVVAGTFQQAARGVQQLPQAMRDYDESYRGRDWKNLAKPMTDPTNPLGSNFTPPEVTPPGNIAALAGTDQTAEPIDVQNISYSTGGMFTPKQMKQQSIERDIPSQQPKSFQQGDLPAGYIPDADPRMVKRRAEAGQVHQDRLSDIARMQQDSANLPRGQFASMGQDSAQGRARANMYSGRSGGSQLPRGNADFQRRHAGEQYARETARMNAQAHMQGVQQTGQLGQAELATGVQQSQLGRESAERIAGAKGLQQASEAQRKSKLEQQKIEGSGKSNWDKMLMIPGISDAYKSIDSSNPDQIKYFEDTFKQPYALYGQLQQQFGKSNDDLSPPTKG